MNLDMVRKPPHPQNEIDVFAGQWRYKLPLPDTTSGHAERFLHLPEQIKLADRLFGGLVGKSCLEFGPNEGEFSFHLHHAGMQPILSIEARPHNFLKCLIVKNALKLDRVQFLLGDVMGFLEETEQDFDLCFNCGVFYHLSEPLRHLELVGRRCRRMIFGTHYFDPRILTLDRSVEATHWSFADRPDQHSHGGLTVAAWRHYYSGGKVAHEIQGQGGMEDFAYMLTKEDLLKAVEHFGWKHAGPFQDYGDNLRGPLIYLYLERG